MRILVTNIELWNTSGTVIYVRDLCIGLGNAHHDVCLYSPRLGKAAKELRSQGIFVTDSLKKIPFVPDIIHGHHQNETAEAGFYFPQTPILFFCHSRFAIQDSPPPLRNITKYMAVDEYCLERLIEAKIPAHLTEVIYNFVDLERFKPRAPLPDRIQKAVIFSNTAKQSTHIPAIKSACDQIGISLDVIGAGMKSHTNTPEDLLGQYDLVFAKAKCAIEAMAVGCAVITYDAKGLGRMVTSENFSLMRRFNFGMKILEAPHEPELIVKEIHHYDSEDAQVVSSCIREEASLEKFLIQIQKLYCKALEEPFTQKEGEANCLKEFKKSVPRRKFRKGAYTVFRFLPFLREPLIWLKKLFFQDLRNLH